MIDINTKEWKNCCKIIDKLEDIADEKILCDCIKRLCANNKESMQLFLNEYDDIIEDESE